MRRGQTRIGGWRYENSRHFSSRNGGNSHYRSSRNYDLPDSHRFPPPSSRSRRPQQYNSRPDNQEQIQEHTDRFRYRNNRHDYLRQPHHSERHMLPLMHQSRHDDHHRRTFKEPTNFYEDVQANHFHVNSMGDIDHRQFPQLNNFRPPLINPWDADTNILQGDKLFNKPFRQDGNDMNKYSDYTGHRPPASDHYGCNATLSVSAIDNSHSFSRSVDDTVDIVRKRLLNRNEPQHHSDNIISNQGNPTNENKQFEMSENYHDDHQEPPTRKKYNRQRRSEDTNCAKIKNKIVHQLFKMDKEKIHKLMDNPNSSNKFEYAISSLITESQNSFNRHMRSVAEKSLGSTSTEFIENDNNTIYEDTFIKQMQCILDPQDTVFLEDIKPIVMAELCKVLQLDEFEKKHIGKEEYINDPRDEQQVYNEISNKSHINDNFQQNGIYSGQTNNEILTDFTRSKSVEPSMEIHDKYHNNKLGYKESEYLYEKRSRRKSCSYYQDNNTHTGNSYFETEYNNIQENFPHPGIEFNKKNVKEEEEQIPKFYDLNSQQCSEEEDPFAELDNQYHVAVDHDFIEDDNTCSPKPPNDSSSSDLNNLQRKFKVEPPIPDKDLEKLTDIQQFSLTDFIKMNSTNSRQDHNSDGSENYKKDTTNQEINDIEKEVDKKEKETPSNSRKRSIDQRPSHRKEKRRKDSCHSESGTQAINKNDNNLNKCEVPKSICNIIISKEENKEPSCKENHDSQGDKSTIEKCIKKKETPKKTPVKDNRTRRKDSISSNQEFSPQDSNSSCQNNSKLETKCSLKTIDMFTEQPRKVSLHQAHRNTAINPIPVHKIGSESTVKTKETLCRQLIKKHVAIQVHRKLPCKETQTVIKKYNSRFCQTVKPKVAVKAVQTDDDDNKEPTTKSTDAFERMKEIDLEIQVLLQEKFKLYNAMGTRDACDNSMQTLGMTVLNVTPFEGDEENITSEDNLLSEDVIVNNFANIASEDLDQIAFESIEEIETPKIEKRNRRRKISYQSISSENSATPSLRKKISKSPNISLLEQIITDDRPLEDIISLDDLEVTPQNKKKLKKGRQTKRKVFNFSYNKGKTSKVDTSIVEIKDCYVVLIREDFSKYLNQQHLSIQGYNTLMEESNEEFSLLPSHRIILQPEMHIDENVSNDIQIDMLDVSEDITVGDNFEDKEEAVVNISVPINEEIILDNNSQSSIEDATGPVTNQGEECKVYDYSSDENLRRDSVIVSGNADAVLALECVETNFLAACLDGNVYYFNNEGQLLTTLRGSNLAVTCLTIVKEKYETTVYTGSLDSRIRYYDLETGIEKGPECNVLSPIQTMDRAWDTVFVGTKTGFVLQFECKNNMLIPVSSVRFSEQSILALRAMKEGPRKVLLVAARSENVTIKDAQTGLLLRTFVGPKMTVYTLLYEDGKVYCGTSSHQIHVFDYTSGGHAGTHEGGKGAVCLRATGGLLFAGCYDGCVYVYREGEARPFAQIRGPSLMLLSLAIVGTKIIAGYKDRSLYIWKIPLSILQEMIL